MEKIECSTIKIDEAAQYLGVSKSTVRRWIKDEGLPALKLSFSGKLLFKKEFLDAWVKEKMNIEEQFNEKYKKEYGELRILRP